MLFRLFAVLLLTGLAAAQPPLRLKAFQRDATRLSRAVDSLHDDDRHKTRTLGRSHFVVLYGRQRDRCGKVTAVRLVNGRITIEDTAKNHIALTASLPL